MASSSYDSLISALTGEYPSFRENELPTSRDLLNVIYNPSEKTDLISRIINPLKDDLLQRAAANKAMLTRSVDLSRSI